jgi:peptidoglycan/LPS O-acetylase OafA/YrhL
MSLDPRNLGYRPEIDGLRAVAVILVMLFHAEVGLVPGGFVGVDVFFVISGYLISQRILYPRLAGEFSYREFYAKRIRRICPALLTTVFVTLLVGSWVLPPDMVMQLATSAATASLSVANVQFFLESGYWDTVSWSKPLLHTWSLGVEEQFYCVWPLALSLIWLRRGTSTLAVLGLLAVLFSIVTAVVTPHFPSAAFYLTPFRIHEFLLGTLAVWLDDVRWENVRGGAALQSLLFLTGLGLILASAAWLDESSVFPGYLVLLPTVGASLIIVSRHSTGIGVALSNRVVRYLGRISYSIYLIHWPILVLLRWQLDELDMVASAAALSATIALAALQYRLVEQRFRYPGATLAPGDDIGYAGPRAALGVGFVVAVALAVISNGGIAQRYEVAFRRIAAMTRQGVHEQRVLATRELCKTRAKRTICGAIDPARQNVLIVGDSQVPIALHTLRSAFPAANFLISHADQCPLLTDLRSVGYAPPSCAPFNRKRFGEIDEIADQLSAIVFAQRIVHPWLPALYSTLAKYLGQRPNLVVLGAGPEFRRDLVPSIIRHGTLQGLDEALQPLLEPGLVNVDESVGRVVATLGGVYLAKHPFFCPNGQCHFLTNDGWPIAYDTNHLTVSAAREFGAYIAKQYPDLLEPGSHERPAPNLSPGYRAGAVTVGMRRLPARSRPTPSR